MLRSLEDLEGYTVNATDGDIGRVVNFLLDDEHWAIRYLVLSTNGSVGGSRVLVTPVSFREIEWEARRFHLALAKDKVAKCPSVDTDRPVSRQHERDYYRYYGYAPYWGYSGLWGMGDYPGLLATERWRDTPGVPSTQPGDTHLRSASEVRGYHVQANDGEVGHVEDFIVDDQTWQIRYIVVDTSNWWFGRKVLVAPQWAKRISWEESNVYLDLSKDSIKNGPEWEPGAAVNREYEIRLYDYYGRPQYWDNPNHLTGAVSHNLSRNHPV